MTFVVDASVTMAWCFESEADAYSDAALAALENGEAVVPSLWVLEVANVLVDAERRRRIGHADTSRFLGLLAALPIAVVETTTLPELGRLLGLARRYRLTAYDATYLHLAVERRLPLATRDRALRAAARAASLPTFES